MTHIDEANLEAEIARLEAELEKARLESQLKKLQSELNAIDSPTTTTNNGTDQYLVIDDQYEYDDDDVSYEEEYIEEYIEEYVDEEDDFTEEYIEEEIPEQAPARSAFGSLQQAHSSLRKTDNNVIKKEIENAALVSSTSIVKEVKPTPAPIVPSPPVEQVKVQVPKMKSKVRPPPSEGGTPQVRVEPKEVVKSTKRFPLSGLLRRNNATTTSTTDTEAKQDDGTFTKTIVKPKRGVPKKPVPSDTSSSSASAMTVQANTNNNATTTSAVDSTTFKRRVIPNLQPSSEGSETIFEQLLGPKLITNIQQQTLQKCTTRGCIKDQELIGLYFGANWKTNCKRFNSILNEFYKIASMQQQQFEIIYISADRSMIEFKDCYIKMPYLAMPPGTTSYKNELTKLLKIIDMPTLVILDDEGSVVSVNGVDKIMQLNHQTLNNNNENEKKIYHQQVNDLINQWKKTRPILMSDVKKDHTLLHNTIERGTVYWN